MFHPESGIDFIYLLGMSVKPLAWPDFEISPIEIEDLFVG